MSIPYSMRLKQTQVYVGGQNEFEEKVFVYVNLSVKRYGWLIF